MRKIIPFLFCFFAAYSHAAVAPYSLPNDVLSLGKPANSSSDKVIRFNKNATNNPAIKWDGTNSIISCSRDGTTFNEIIDGSRVDGSTITFGSHVISVASGGVNTTQLATGAVTQAKMATRSTGTTVGAGGVAISSDCGAFSSTSGSATQVTNLSVTITTTGRPVFIGLMDKGSLSPPTQAIECLGVSSSNPACFIYVYGGASGTTKLAEYDLTFSGTTTGLQMTVPASSISFLDTPAAGTYTYNIKVQMATGVSMQLIMSNVKLYAYEI